MNTIKCEACQGAGVVPGKVCSTCHGASLAIVVGGRVLYFGQHIDRLAIKQEAINKAVRSVVAFLLAAFGLFGLVLLALDVWPEIDGLFFYSFWKDASWYKIVFVCSLFTDLYLVSRLLRINDQYEDIRPALKKELKNVPTTWQDIMRLPKTRRVDVSRAYSARTLQSVKSAYKFSAKLKHSQIGPLHIFVTLMSLPVVGSLFSRLEVEQKGLEERIRRALGKEVKGEGEPEFAPVIKLALLQAYVLSGQAGSKKVEGQHLIAYAIAAHEGLQEILFDLGIDKAKLKNAFRWLDIDAQLSRRWREFKGAAARRPKGSMNRAMTALQTRILDRFSDDLTLMAGRGYLEMTVDRDKAFEEIFRVFEGERKSVLLVGPHGVGKEAILNGLAERMVEEQVPKLLQDRRLAMLSLPKLVAGARASEVQERLLACLSDVGRARNVVLAIPNVHEAIGGRESGLNLGETLASELGKGYFLSLATTTPEEYRTRIEGTALGNAFIKVDIGEPDGNTSIQILESKTGPIEFKSKVYFSYNALEKAVVLSDRYLKDYSLPEKAIDIIKESAQYVRQKRGEKAMVRGEDVAEIISQKSHVSVTTVTATEADKLLNLEKVMHERIVGQDEAVKAIAAALRRARAGLREGKRPIANFLFLGPTGVGKTETAKTVAEVYFGNEQNMIRIDMSEYQDQTGVHRLIGAPGQKGGLLTEPVRKNPSSLILLDEIEKAYPDILNIFLQVMDDGRITDSVGRVVDFTNAIIIATSNAGTQFVQEAIRKGQTMEQIKKDLMERELKQYFKPEFLNRFDGIVVYKALTEQEIVSIAKLMLVKVAEQLDKKGITFRLTEEALVELAQAGFDPQYGARPLRRVIQERVNDALANLLLEKKVGRRDVVILDKGGQFRVEKAERL